MNDPRKPDYEKIEFAAKRILSLLDSIRQEFRQLSDDEKKFMAQTMDMLNAVTPGVQGCTNLSVMAVGYEIIGTQMKGIQQMIANRKKLKLKLA